MRPVAIVIELVHRTRCADDHHHKKVNILINDAGFGKTAYFTWLTWWLPTLNNSRYVVKLNAMECCIDFERLGYHKIQEYGDTEVIRLLYHFMNLELFTCNVNRQTIAATDQIRDIGDRCAKLLSVANDKVELDDELRSTIESLTATQLVSLRLFREKLNAKEFVILLDGLDEIAPYHKEAVLTTFKRFSELPQVHAIYISSRPYDFEEDFRGTFCQSNLRMYRLKPLTRRIQLLSLHKFLVRELKDEYLQCEADYRQLRLRLLYAILDNALNDVKTVPLLLDMAFS